tara:strand:+ start:1041 stop:1559 length:519 start_codon:yes stop_codon:yes gene_type:complete
MDQQRLYIACESGDLKEIQQLHARGADMDVTRPNNNGSTPMYKACERGNFEIVQWLLTHGDDTDVMGKYCQMTPLEVACKYDHFDIVLMFISKGYPVVGKVIPSLKFLTPKSKEGLYKRSISIHKDNESFFTYMNEIHAKNLFIPKINQNIVREFLCGINRSRILWEEIWNW